MKRNLVTLCVLFVALAGLGQEAFADEPRAFELRVYTAEEGKLEALHRRFREHTIALFEKHGVEIVGFWTPSQGEEAANTLVYLLAFPSQEARDLAWKAFVADPEWQRVYTESRKDGPLVKKVESTMLGATDYSPLD